jgi:hypothetical protein
MAEWLKAHAWKACVRETVPWVRIPLSPPRYSTRAYPIVRRESKTNEYAFAAHFCDVARTHPRQTVVVDREFGGWIFRHRPVLTEAEWPQAKSE